MIVKIQLPLWSSEPDGGKALICNKDKDVFVQMHLEDVASLFGSDETKIYHHAHMEGTILHIDERAPDQDW